MISVKHINHNKQFRKGKNIITFTRKDVNPQIVAPLFTNEKLSPISIECMQDFENGDNFQRCQFIDAYKQKIIVQRISFINHQVSNPSITSFKHPEGSMITKMDFEKPVNCEFFGLNSTGLTLKCVDKKD